MTDSGVLKYGDHELDLPVVKATDGNDGLDIGKLLSTTGVTTLDPGFVNTASCTSEITFIDGDEGILRYRGYPIEQLAQNSTYLEVAWLLLYGDLPTADQLAEWDDKIRHHTLLHEDLKRFFSSLPHTAHPQGNCRFPWHWNRVPRQQALHSAAG